MLMMDVTDGIIEYGKEVTRVEPQGERQAAQPGAILHFADGSTEEADLVVVADGLYSVSCP
jgi:2-polyprenyl-6-methoxyphenol hydroxylase-like FAD-dependent oxidoreductase